MSKSFVLLWSLLVFPLLSSCGLVVVDGFSSKLNRLSEEEKARVFRTDAPIASLPCDSNVYIVGEAQIWDCIRQHDSCVVYDWYPSCPYSITPSQFEQCCDSMGYYPIIIMSCFCYHGFNRFDTRHTPILFPDLEPYHTNIVYKYMNQFSKNMTGEEQEMSVFWRYRGGEFISFIYKNWNGGTLKLDVNPPLADVVNE